MKYLDRTTIDGIELEYMVLGAGEPVVLVHAGIFADWFKPLLQEPALIGRYRVVSYHRIGYAGSSRVAGPVSIAQQAAHLRGGSIALSNSIPFLIMIPLCSSENSDGIFT